MEKEKIVQEVGFRGQHYRFHLGMLSIEDESEYFDRLSSVKEKDPTVKREKEHKILIDGYVAWSTQMPEKLIEVEEKDEESGEMKKRLKYQPLPGDSIADAFEKEFGIRTPFNSRLMNVAVIRFREAMTPNVDFQ